MPGRDGARKRGVADRATSAAATRGESCLSVYTRHSVAAQEGVQIMLRRSVGVALVTLVLAGCGSDDDDRPRATPTGTPVGGVTATPTDAVDVPATATATATAPGVTGTPVATDTPGVPTATASATVPPTATPTITATPVPPELLMFGVVRADDLLQEPDGFDSEGRPIFVRAQGQGMSLVVEARRGGARLLTQAYDPDGAPAGVEFVVSRPLGDGSTAVCDLDETRIGGVPGVPPPFFTGSAAERDAIADLGCRVNDGTGQPVGRTATAACTRDAGAIFGFTDARAELQYCLPIARAWGFPSGDTIVAARVRDIGGTVSAVREIVIRVEGSDFACDGGLGERVFTPNRPGSVLLINSEEGDVSTGGWQVDPLRLCAGAEISDGVHPLTLREDVQFRFATVDGGVLCGTIRARGANGLLDCDGGLPLDVRAVMTAGDPRIVVDSGIGAPAGTGAASLNATIRLRTLPVGASPVDCIGAGGGVEFLGALTTATGTAEVHDTDGEIEATLSVTGIPFDCGRWRIANDPAAFVLPIPAIGTPAGTVAAAIVFGN